eukprot:4794739-Prymnesium_polylepis.1
MAAHFPRERCCFRTFRLNVTEVEQRGGLKFQSPISTNVYVARRPFGGCAWVAWSDVGFRT